VHGSTNATASRAHLGDPLLALDRRAGEYPALVHVSALDTQPTVQQPEVRYIDDAVR